MYFSTGAELQAALNALPASKVGDFTAFDSFYYGQTYMSGGKYTGTLSPIEHFVQIGAAQGNQPDATFDPSFYMSQYPDLQGKGFNAADLLYQFMKFGLDEGRIPNATLASFNATAYLAEYPDVKVYVDANLAQFGGSESNGALAHYVKFGSFEGRDAPGTFLTTGGNTHALTTGVDNLSGTTFVAPINDNTNTFQSGDVLTGTGAHNVLNADLGNSANFAILASTTGIQTVNITAEAQAIGSASTNNLSTLPVEINALRMHNVTYWGDLQSRADVVIENIQLPNGNTSSDVTKDVTFIMRDTQPGNINGTTGGGTNVTTHGPSFSAYFDPQALKPAPTLTVTSNILYLNEGNSSPNLTAPQFAANPVAPPLTPVVPPVTIATPSFPYAGFSIIDAAVSPTVPLQFYFSAADILALENATGAAQQAAFETAVKDAQVLIGASGYTTLSGLNIKVTGIQEAATTPVTVYNFSSGDPAGIPRSNPSVVLTAPTGATLTVAPILYGVAGSVNPGTIFVESSTIPNVISTSYLITSNLIVDNVGQGGYPQMQTYAGSTEGPGGDAIIGSMATSGGVQQINIDVQRTSWNNSVQTTNNMLQVVNISSDPAYLSKTPGGQGYAIGAELVPGSGNMINWAAPGQFVGTHGLQDVQTVDAAGGHGLPAFNGSLEIGETIDYQGFVKYLAGATGVVPFTIALGNQSNGFNVPNLTNQSNNVIVPGWTEPFNSVNLAIDPSVAGSGNFFETITGGTGSDVIKVAVVNTTGASIGALASNGAWETSMTQAIGNKPVINTGLVINAGDGNNTVIFQGGGAAQITTNGGTDAIYIDNTGGTGNIGTALTALLKAAWVTNANTATTDTTVAPTAIETTQGTPGVSGAATTTWVNIPTNATAATIVSAEDVAVNAPIAPLAPNLTGSDLQGVRVIDTQAAGAAALSTTTIAADVLTAYTAYIAGGGGTAATHTTAGAIAWNDPAFAASTNAATDVMTETFVIGGNTLAITIGNEYVITQTSTQVSQGIDGLTRTVTGPTSWSQDGQRPLGTSAPGYAPTVANVVAGMDAHTEQQTVTWTSLLGNGASETIGGITVKDNQVGGATTFTAAQVAAAVDAGNGTYGSLVVTGVSTPAATGWTPTNPYAGLAAGASETVNGVTVFNNTAGAITAAVVAADVALPWVGSGAVVQVSGTPTAAAASNLLTYGTANTTYAPGTLAALVTSGTTTATAGTQVSIDAYGNLTTFAPTQTGANPYTFTGSGETVTFTYEGKSVSALITPETAVTTATYTTTDVNNAIAKAVNADPVMSKLIHATQGSASMSLIFNSLVDGVQTAPTIAFTHPGTIGVATSTTGLDGTALSLYTAVQPATGNGTLVSSGGTSAIAADTITGLTGAPSAFVNNSSVIDSGGTNVIDLSSNSLSVNTVTLTGTGTSYLVNVGTNEVISIAATSTTLTNIVVINYANAGAAGATVTIVGDTAPVITAHTGDANVTALMAAVVGQPAHTVYSEVIGGNQYYADANGVGVELVGAHTASVVAGHLLLA